MCAASNRFSRENCIADGRIMIGSCESRGIPRTLFSRKPRFFQDHNRIASVSLGNNDAYFVTFEDGCWQYSGIPSSMHKYIQEQEIKKNYRNETFEQIAFSQDLEEWYLRTNKRWWYQSRKLRSLEDTYKKWGQNGLNAKRYQASLSLRSERGLTWGLRRSNHSSYGAVKTPLGPAVTIWAMKNTLVDREINGLNHTWCAVDDWLLLLIGK